MSERAPLYGLPVISSELAELFGDNDPQWKDVNEDTLVLWDGKPCTFGDLSQNEKMECNFSLLVPGLLIGGYPF